MRLPSPVARPRSLAALAWSALAACTTEAPAPSARPEPADAPTTERLALLSLTWRADDPGLAQGHVVDYAPGELRRALEILSEPSALPLLDASLGLDQCRVERRAQHTAPMVLRDAGELSIEVAGALTPLEFRWLPEGSLGVSGPAYAGLLPPLGDAAMATFAADGSAELGAFTISTPIPPRVTLRTVGGAPVQEGRAASWISASDASLASELPADGLALTWDPPTAKARPDALRDAASAELTLVLYERVAFGETWSITCAAHDDGHFTIPAAAVLALPELGPDQTDRVLVRRIAGASFAARAVPDGLAIVVREDAAYLE